MTCAEWIENKQVIVDDRDVTIKSSRRYGNGYGTGHGTDNRTGYAGGLCLGGGDYDCTGSGYGYDIMDDIRVLASNIFDGSGYGCGFHGYSCGFQGYGIGQMYETALMG